MDEIFGIEVKKRDDGFEANFPQDLPGVSQQFLIWWSDTGLKVPNAAIVSEDDKNYVVRSRAGYLNKLLVKVSRSGDKYSIVEPFDTEELKEMGYSSEEIINYRKISIYDEIIINPDLSKVEE